MGWEENILLKGLTPEELSVIERNTTEKTFKPSDLILAEGSEGTELYLIEEGEVEVLKDDWLPGRSYRLTRLRKGETIGEMALLGNRRRLASIRALQTTKVRELSLEKLGPAYPEILSKITKNLGSLLSARLSKTDEMVVSALKKEYWQAKKQEVMSDISAKLIYAIVLYQLIVGYLIPWIGFQELAFVSPLFIIFMSILCVNLIKRSGYSFKFYAVTMRNWKVSLFESLIASIPFLLAVVLLKMWILHSDPRLSSVPLFELGLGAAPPSLMEETFSHSLLAMGLYIAFSPLQEFVFRGVIQSTMIRFLVIRNRVLVAILLSNLLFVQAHFYWNFSIILLIPGFLWSWLVLRHRTLIGASFSHMLLAFWAFFVVGLNPVPKESQSSSLHQPVQVSVGSEKGPT